MHNMNYITIFTDGSSRGNPGPGGWGAVLVTSDPSTKAKLGTGHGKLKVESLPAQTGGDAKVTELGGREDHTTNNRMELMAAIEALKYIELKKIEVGEVAIHADSAYVLGGITIWIHAWQKNNWRTSTNKQVLNQDLWQALFEVTRRLSLRTNLVWKKVKGHAGVIYNERADIIATSFADKERVLLFSGSEKQYVEYLKSNV